MISKLATGVAFAALLAGPAMAADMVDYVDPAAGYDWSGPYIGAHIGYGEADVDGEFTAGSGLSGLLEFGLEPNGIIGGVQAGWNWQTDSLVLGVEGDLSLANWDDSLENGAGQRVEAEIDWLATLRARVGWAVDNLLIFGTLGAAWIDGEYQVDPSTATADDETSVDLEDMGLVVGGGLEWGWDEAWSFKLEGLWFNFKDSPDVSGLGQSLDDFVELGDAWVVWFGVNLHL